MDSNPLDIPLGALRLPTQQLLSTLLNPIKIIPTENGLFRDWRGLADLAKITTETVIYLESCADPTKELLRKMSQIKNCNNSFHQCNDLTSFLAMIDRYDVLEDSEPLFQSDGLAYAAKLQGATSSMNTNEVSSLDNTHETLAITVDDTERLKNKQPLRRYDAFILHADDDVDFAAQVVKTLESNYHLQICSKDRDLLPGVMFEQEAIGRLIEERCNRLLVIFSPSFLQSRANQFLVSFTQAVALDSNTRKIIPCVYKRCMLPSHVRVYHCLDYNRSGPLYNFWDKLHQSLVNTQTSAASAITSKVPNSVTNSTKTTDVSSKSQALLDSLHWWDAQKSKPVNARKDTLVSQDGDAMSVSSSAMLLSKSKSASGDEAKNSKWLNKLMSPIKKVRDKSKQSPKKKALAELAE